MIKLMIAARRRADVSFEVFKKYYESNHAPLAKPLGYQGSGFAASNVLKDVRIVGARS